jgi:hypothetical protein
LGALRERLVVGFLTGIFLASYKMVIYCARNKMYMEKITTIELKNLSTYICCLFNLVLIIWESTQSQDTLFSSLDSLEFELVCRIKLFKFFLET